MARRARMFGAIVAAFVSIVVVPSAASAVIMVCTPKGPTINSVNQTPTTPEAGLATTLTVNASGGTLPGLCMPATMYAYQFTTYHGPPPGTPPAIDTPPASAQNTYTFTFPSAGTYTVVIDVFSCAANCPVTEQQFTVTVQPPVSGAITTFPTGNVQLGSTQTFTANGTGGVPPYTYTWQYNGPTGTSGATGSTIQRLFPNGQSEFVQLNGQPFPTSNMDPTEYYGDGPNTPVPTNTGVQITDANGATSVPIRVTSNVVLPDVLQATIAPPSGTIYAGVPTTLTAAGPGGTGSPTGGVTPLSYVWQINSTATAAIGTGPSVTYTFPSPGTYTELLTVSDSAAPHVHALLTQFTVTVVAPPVITPTPTPPSPSNCPSGSTQQTVTFALTQAVGCFVTGGTPQTPTYTATSAITINNIPINLPSGGSIVLTAPSSGHPGGSISSALAAVVLPLPAGKLLDLIENQLQFDLPSLPSGTTSGQAKVVSIGPASGVSLFGFKIGGQVTINFGTDGAGNYYSTFDIELNLPEVFKSGLPSKSNPPGGVMGQVELKDTASGINFNGLQFVVNNAYIGDIQLQNLCFSLIPGGSAITSSCTPDTVAGGSFTSPASNLGSCVNTTPAPAGVDVWMATTEIVLPTPSSTTIAAFGGGQTNTSTGATQINYLGAQGSNLNIPIAEGVTLNTLGGGICFNPLVLTANLGVGLLPIPDKGDAATIDGSLTYTAGTATSPWMLDMKGSVDIFSNPFGTAEVTVQQGGDFSFAVTTNFSIGTYVTLDGGLSGWVEPEAKFNIDGNVSVTVKVGPVSASASAEGVASSTGIAGCITVGVSPFSISAGAGYTWATKQVTLMGGSCSVGAFEATAAADIAAAGGAKKITIAPGQAGTALQIRGTSGPPRVRIKGPHGFRLTQPADKPLVLVKGKYLLMEDPRTNSTDVLIVHPAGGSYTISSLTASDHIAAIKSAKVLPPFTGHGKVTGHGTRRKLRLSYKLPANTQLALVERGAHLIRTIATNVHGHSCRHGSLCFSTTFTPASGTATKRTVEAVLERGGLPLKPVVVAHFTVGRLKLPSKPAKLQLVASGSTVTARWSRSTGAAHYSVRFQSDTGQQSTLLVGPKCRGTTFTSNTGVVGVTATVEGVRFDSAVGKANTATIQAGAASGGATGKPLTGRLC